MPLTQTLHSADFLVNEFREYRNAPIGAVLVWRFDEDVLTDTDGRLVDRNTRYRKTGEDMFERLDAPSACPACGR